MTGPRSRRQPPERGSEGSRVQGIKGSNPRPLEPSIPPVLAIQLCPWFDAHVTEFIAILSDEEIRRERAKARELRQSPWWKRKRSTGICHYCGNKFAAAELTMDHLVPLVRGGRSTKGNVVPACKECNTKKKHQLPSEWQQE